MTPLGRLSYLRRTDASDDAFLHDVFCTTWQDEVAALPNQNLARHILRIQHIAQERRFGNLYPGLQKFIVLEGRESAGRLYVSQGRGRLHIVDLTVMPEFRSRGIATRLVRDLCDLAAHDGRAVRMRTARRNDSATTFCARLGFQLIDEDDLDYVFEWRAPADYTPGRSHSALASASARRGIDFRQN